MNGVYFLLGTNIGDRIKNLATATSNIKNKIGELIQSSGIYETEAWGKTDQPGFLNQVLFVETKLTATEILIRINDIEIEIGRVRFQKWAERIIDIDILYYNKDVIITETLLIPHPEIQNRRFTLVPLAEIAPDFLHPVLQKTSLALLKDTTDQLQVHKLNV